MFFLPTRNACFSVGSICVREAAHSRRSRPLVAARHSARHCGQPRAAGRRRHTRVVSILLIHVYLKHFNRCYSTAFDLFSQTNLSPKIRRLFFY